MDFDLDMDALGDIAKAAKLAAKMCSNSETVKHGNAPAPQIDQFVENLRTICASSASLSIIYGSNTTIGIHDTARSPEAATDYSIKLRIAFLAQMQFVELTPRDEYEVASCWHHYRRMADSVATPSWAAREVEFAKAQIRDRLEAHHPVMNSAEDLYLYSSFAKGYMHKRGIEDGKDYKLRLRLPDRSSRPIRFGDEVNIAHDDNGKWRHLIEPDVKDRRHMHTLFATETEKRSITDIWTITDAFDRDSRSEVRMGDTVTFKCAGSYSHRRSNKLLMAGLLNIKGKNLFVSESKTYGVDCDEDRVEGITFSICSCRQPRKL